MRESERARRLDPLSLIIAADNGVILYYARQYDRALAQFRAVREMDPHFSRAGMIREVYSQMGMFAEILAEDDQWQRTVGDAHWILAERACVYGRSGQQAQARLALEKLKALNREHPIEPALFVEAYIGMDNKDQPFIWLERAFEQHSNCMTTLKVDPLYDPLRSDPRFQDLLRRVGLAQ